MKIKVWILALVVFLGASGFLASAASGGPPKGVSGKKNTKATMTKSRSATTRISTTAKSQKTNARRQNSISAYINQRDNPAAGVTTSGTRQSTQSQAARQGRSKSFSNSDRRSRVVSETERLARHRQTISGPLKLVMRKRKMMQDEGREASKMRNMTNSLIIEHFKIGETEVSCGYEAGDKRDKIEALKAALKEINTSGYTLPKSIDVVFSMQKGVQNRAFMCDEKGHEKTQIFFGPKFGKTDVNDKGRESVANEFSSQKMCIATVVHELGHVLHMRASPEVFWAGKMKETAPPNSASKFTFYSQRNNLEFVAEAFTAIIMGKKIDQQVLTDYQNCGGAMPKKP